MNISDVITFLSFMSVAYFIGFLVGGNCGKSESHQEAIEAGVGEYYVDKDHDKQFRYKTDK